MHDYGLDGPSWKADIKVISLYSHSDTQQW